MGAKALSPAFYILKAKLNDPNITEEELKMILERFSEVATELDRDTLNLSALRRSIIFMAIFLAIIITVVLLCDLT